jgi:Na+/H+ antiporter NhaC
MSTKQIIPIIALVAVLSIFMGYTTSILSENDDQINVTGTGYEETHESNVRVQNATLSLMSPVAMILGVVLLIFALVFLKQKGRRKY